MLRTGTRPAELVRARWGVAAMFLANGAGYGVWASSIAGIKQGLGASDGALGAALLCVAAGAVVAMPVAGWLGARGKRRLLSWTALLFAAALPLPVVAGSVPALGGFALLLGAGAGSMDVCMNARASRIEQGWGAAIMSSFHAAFAVGGLLGTGLVALAVALGWGVGGGLLLGSVLLLAAMALHARLDPAAELGGAGGRIGWPSPAVLGVGVLCLLAFLSEGAVADWSGVFLRDVAGYVPPADVLGFATFEVGMIAGRLAGDAAVRRLGPAVVLRLGAGLAAAGVLLAIATPQIGPLGFGLVGLGGANIAPVLFTAGGRAGPAGIAAVATLGYGGMLLGPPVIGGLAELAGLRAALLVIALAMTAIGLGGRLGR